MVDYYKLVRDKIPDLIKQQGETPTVEVLSDEQYLLELDKKLYEEIGEYQESKELEELADAMEVIYAICAARGFSKDALHRIRDEKCKARGGFSKKYYLVSKE